MYKESRENLEAMGMNISDAFFSYDISHVALLQGVRVLLDSITEEGLVLRAGGFLPEAIVKSVAEVGATEYDKKHSYLQQQNHFYENEHVCVWLTHIVIEVQKLVQTKDGRLFLTNRAKEYLGLGIHQQYIILLELMFTLNLSSFDLQQEAIFINNMSAVVLQLLRDENRGFRPTKKYAKLLAKKYTTLEYDIEALAFPELGEGGKFDAFVAIIKLRLFERFFLPLGLIEMQVSGDRFKPDQFSKSSLLERLLPHSNQSDEEGILKSCLDFLG